MPLRVRGVCRVRRQSSQVLKEKIARLQAKNEILKTEVIKFMELVAEVSGIHCKYEPSIRAPHEFEKAPHYSVKLLFYPIFIQLNE